jgi:hypothetical protein
MDMLDSLKSKVESVAGNVKDTVKQGVQEAKLKIDDRMKLPAEYYGPQLHFLGRKDDRWRVRVVVGWRPAKKDPKDATPAEPLPIFTSAASVAWVQVRDWRQLDCKVGPNVEFVLYALDGEVTLSDQAQNVTYGVEFGGQQRRECTFAVPAKSEDATLGYCSCNDVQRNEGRQPSAYLSWRKLLDEHAQSPYHVMIAGGDQIYGDAAYVEDTMNDETELEAFYLREYLGRFAKEPHMAMALSAIPFVMQPDDHDYYNGVGSMGDQEPHVVRRVAHKYRFLFQLGRAAEEAELDGVRTESSGVVVTGPNVAVLNLDMRSARNMLNKQEPLMRQATFDGLVAELRKEVLPVVKPKHLIVLLAVPPVFVQNDELAKILEVVFDTKTTSDLRDSALSLYNIGQTQAILNALFELAKEFLVRLTFISGDAHVWGTGSARSKTHDGTFDDDFRGAQLWISSPMCNEPKEALVPLVKAAKETGHITRELGELVMTVDEVHAERNWMRITVDPTAKALHGVFIRDTNGSANFVPLEPLKVMPLVAPPPPEKKESGCCIVA